MYAQKWGIYMNDLIWNSREVKDKISDKNLMDIIWEILPIYSTTDFYQKIYNLRSFSQDITAIGMGSFWYKNSVHLQYVPRNKVENAKYIYECCHHTGHLADYDFAAVNNKHANSFYLLFLYDNDSFANYSELQNPAELSQSQRNTLFCSLKSLADEGVFVPLYSISYNKTTGEFSLFDYSDVIVDKSVDVVQKQEYIDFHKKILLS